MNLNYILIKLQEIVRKHYIQFALKYFFLHFRNNSFQ